MIKYKLLVIYLFVAPVLFAQKSPLQKSVVFADGKIVTNGDPAIQQLHQPANTVTGTYTLTEEGVVMDLNNPFAQRVLMQVLKDRSASMKLKGIDDFVYRLHIRPLQLDNNVFYGIHLLVPGPIAKDTKMYLLLVNKNGDCKVVVTDDFTLNRLTPVYSSQQNDWVKPEGNELVIEKFGNQWKLMVNEKVVYEKTETVTYKLEGLVPDVFLEKSGKLLLHSFRFDFHGETVTEKPAPVVPKLPPTPPVTMQTTTDTGTFNSIMDALAFIKKNVRCGEEVQILKQDDSMKVYTQVFNAKFDYRFTAKDTILRYSYFKLYGAGLRGLPANSDTIMAEGKVRYTQVEFSLRQMRVAKLLIDDVTKEEGCTVELWSSVPWKREIEDFVEYTTGERVYGNKQQEETRMYSIVDIYCYDKRVRNQIINAFNYIIEQLSKTRK